MGFFQRFLDTPHHRLRMSMFQYERARKQAEQEPSSRNVEALLAAAENLGIAVRSDLEMVSGMKIARD